MCDRARFGSGRRVGAAGKVQGGVKSSCVDIHLDVFARNLGLLRDALGPATSLVLVVKADAYGHGLTPIARQAAAAGVTWFAVAYLHEALAVRAISPKAHIVILGAVEPADVPELVEQDILPIVVSEEHGRALAGAAQQAGVVLKAHVKVDTGMGRFGLAWEDAVATTERLARLPGLSITGMCTHFASVEPRKPALGPEQMERFRGITQDVQRRLREPLFRHASSSRAFQYCEDWDLDAVRPGIVAYGYGARERGMRVHTRPVLQWRTAVMQVKRVPAGFPVGYYSTHVTPAPTVLATIAGGYADGYHRALSNRGFALVRGRRRAVVGRVSMNWITLDCGPDREVEVGDEVVLLGEQGQESVWADDLARLGRTIAYEVLTSIHAGLPRHYLGAVPR
jgi:alanine racemase